MKKKYLSSLKKIAGWLEENSLFDQSSQDAVELLRLKIQEVPEIQEEESNELPLPAELKGSDAQFALYSDGACRGNPGPGAFAFVVQDREGKIVVEGREYEALTTNNKMELRGAIDGLQELIRIMPELQIDHRLSYVKVMTDSKYVVDGISQWVKNWKLRGWKKADNKTPENLELWQTLDVLVESFFRVEWVWVKGHAGHKQNEYCDRKANEAIDSHH